MRRLHFGCGPNHLPEPWENFDREVDISQPLPFPDGCARYIFAEHVIEHVPFAEGMVFLVECRRVLVPLGVLRFAFPDVGNFVDDDINSRERTSMYCAYLSSRLGGGPKTRSDVFRSILLEHGHRAAWTGEIAIAALEALGFESATPQPYGDSSFPVLQRLEGHHKTSPVAVLETTIIEAIK